MSSPKIKNLIPGRYHRTWAGYTIEVELRFIGRTLVEIAPSGLMTYPETMPDAVWAPISRP